MKNKTLTTIGNTSLNLYIDISLLDDFTIVKSEPKPTLSNTEFVISKYVTFKIKGVLDSKDSSGDIETITAGFHCTSEYNKTEFGIFCNELSEIAKQSDVNISEMDFAYLINEGSFDKIIELYNEYKKSHNGFNANK